MSDNDKKVTISKSVDKSINLPEKTSSTNTEIIAGAYGRLDEDKKKELDEKAASAAIDIQIERAKQLNRFDVGRKETEDHVETANALNQTNRLDRHKIITEVETGSGTRRIVTSKGAACFVATSAFNNENSITVVRLRCFRDSTLRKSVLGRKFISWYYQNGPRLASLLDKNNYLKPAVRLSLKTLVLILRIK